MFVIFAAYSALDLILFYEKLFFTSKKVAFRY